MYLLYLDDSGSPSDPSQKFFVMAGVCVFERQTHWLEGQLSEIARRFHSDADQIEMHGSPMRSGTDGWKAFSPNDRSQAVVDALHLLSDPQMKMKVFACVVEKAKLKPADIVPHAFETIAVQFDAYLAWLHSIGNTQRGLVIFDEASFEKNVQALSRTFKHVGHAKGRLRNFAEVPLFIDSKASRMIQMADLVAYWIFRRYEALDARGFSLIEPYFHAYGGIRHGLCEAIEPATLQAVTAAPPYRHPFAPPSGLGVKLAPAEPVSTANPQTPDTGTQASPPEPT